LNSIIEAVGGSGFGEIEDFCKDIIRDTILKRQTVRPDKIINTKIRQFKDSCKLKKGE
jgi:hypothetical protein